MPRPASALLKNAKAIKTTKTKVAKPVKNTKTAKVKVSTKKVQGTGKRGRPAAFVPPKGTDNPCAALVRKLRKASGLNLDDFGAKVGMYGTAVARLENDDYFSATIGTLIKITSALGKTLTVSFGDKVKKSKSA